METVGSWTLAVVLVCSGCATVRPATAPVQQAREAERTRPPRVAQFVAPSYPPTAREVGAEGTVWMDVDVDAAGHVVRAETKEIKLQEHFHEGKHVKWYNVEQEFEASAVAAVRQWTFSPALVNGEPAAAKITVPVVFGLADQPPN